MSQETKALVQTEPPHPLALLQQAIAQGITPEQLGKLVELQERYERNRAAEQFASAVTRFQAECPVVFKCRKAGAGNIQFDYAAYDDVMRAAAPLLAKHCIAITYTTEQAESKIRCICRVRVGIHSEETTVTIPVPSGKVNDAQLHGQAVTYAKRYALCAALNIVVSDEDTDAGSMLDTLTEEEVGALNGLLIAKAVDEEKFLAWARAATGLESIDSIAELPRALFAKATDMLNRRKAGAK